MPDYVVNWNYRSGLAGPWKAGEVVGVDEATAEAVNRDSPGVLTPAPVAALTGEGRVVEAPPQDRMARAAENQRKKKSREDDGVMTSKNMPISKSLKKDGE